MCCPCLYKRIVLENMPEGCLPPAPQWYCQVRLRRLRDVKFFVSFIRPAGLQRQFEIAVVLAGPPVQAGDRSGPCRTRTANPGSEYCPPDANSKEWSPPDWNGKSRIRVAVARPKLSNISRETPMQVLHAQSRSIHMCRNWCITCAALDSYQWFETS